MGDLELILGAMTPWCLYPTDGPLRVLVLGAHADDIEIGAGATLLHLQRERPVAVHALIFSATTERADEAKRSGEMLFADATDATVDVRDFAENLFPDQLVGLKRAVGELRDFAPHLVISHYLGDRHQDHRTIAELTWQAFRDHSILQFEIPKWEGDLTTPNAYVALDDELIDRKIEIITTAFTSQHDKPWFDSETFRALARIRGVECGQRWAEAFHADKTVLSMSTPRVRGTENEGVA